MEQQQQFMAETCICVFICEMMDFSLPLTHLPGPHPFPPGGPYFPDSGRCGAGLLQQKIWVD